MPARDLPKTLTRDQVDQLMSRPNLAAPTGLRNRVALELMYRCGLRAAEVCGLHLRDWHPRDEQIHLRPEVAKGGREAYVYLDSTVTSFLEQWKIVRRRYAAGKPHLITTLAGGPVDRRYLWEMTARYARRAGIEEPVWPHRLRHTFAVELLRDGTNIREVQLLMRHADLRTTAIYLGIHQAELRDRVKQRAW